MQRPASSRWQKVVLGVGLYTQCGAVSTLDGSIKVPVHNTRRAAIDTGVVAWNVALRRVTSRVSHLTPRWRKPDRTLGPPQERHRRPIRQYAEFSSHNG